MTESNRRPHNDGMALVRQVTMWLAAGGVAATGLFAGVAVASNAGHTTVARKATTSGAAATSGTTTTTTTTAGSTQSAGTPQFQAPITAPSNVTNGPAVVSGGS